jgi:hypothetical protein
MLVRHDQVDGCCLCAGSGLVLLQLTAWRAQLGRQTLLFACHKWLLLTWITA